MSEIARNIRKIADRGAMVICGEVKSVDEHDMSCTVRVDGEDEIIASLVVGNENKGIVQIPEVGSIVAVVMTSKSNGFVVMTEKIKEIRLNGGELGGLIKIQELQKNLNKISGRIDKIIDALTNSAVTPKDGGLTYKTNIQAALSGLDKENFSAIEDEIIKH